MRAAPIGIAARHDEPEDLSDLAMAFHRREGLRELQGEVLPPIVIGVAAVAFCLLEFYSEFAQSRSWIPLWALLVTSAVVYKTRQRHVPAALLLVITLLAVTSSLIWLYPRSSVSVCLALHVLIAGVLLGHRGSFGIAVASSAILVAAVLHDGAVSIETLFLSLFLVWGVAFLHWLSARPLYTALGWSWSSYVQALQQTRELRFRQGELVALSKGLEDAYRRLENLNLELEHARKEAEEARRQKAEFAATISHELRTPLNLIVGFSEMMVVRPLDSYGESLPESFRGDVEAIYRGACHISNLIDDVLDLSQIEAHRMALYKEPSLISEVITEAVATVRGMFEDKGLSLSAQVPDDLPPLWLDRARIRQILINLLANAARFTNAGGVTVGAELNANDIVLSVSDTGIGIKQEELPEVFQEFHQVGPVERRSRRTTGLGLAISRRFAEMHGGCMWVTSKPGTGSTFYVALPLADAAPILPAVPKAPPVAGTATEPQKTVVVVDEGGQAFGVIQRYLDGYRVLKAAGLSQVGRLVDRGSRYAVLFPQLQDGDGQRYLEGSREVPGNAAVVVCPLRTVSDLRQELGVADYLLKPVTREQLQVSFSRLPHRPHRILVIDDDPEMVRLLSRLARSISKRNRLFSAYDGAEGLRLMRERQPDLVLLDLLMPEVSGYEVLERMKAEDALRTIPVVVVSAKGRVEESVVARMVGVTRPGGLTVGEAMRCVKSSLDAIFNWQEATSPAQ